MKTTTRLFTAFALGCALAAHKASADIIIEFKSVLPLCGMVKRSLTMVGRTIRS